MLAMQHIKSNCILLGEEFNKELKAQLDKMDISPQDIKKIPDLSDYYRFEISRGSTVQTEYNFHLMKFKFKDIILKNNYLFRKSLFMGKELSYSFPYQTFCFENKKLGALLFIKDKRTMDINGCAKKWSSDSTNAALYLNNLYNIFTKYEEGSIRVIRFAHSKLGCSLRNISVPIILDPNILYLSNDKLHEHFYKKIMKPGKKAHGNNIINLYTGKEIDIVYKFLQDPTSSTQPMILNSYSFLHILRKACFIINTTVKNIPSNVRDILNNLIELLDECVIGFEKAKLKMLSSEKMRNIYEYLNSFMMSDAGFSTSIAPSVPHHSISQYPEHVPDQHFGFHLNTPQYPTYPFSVPVNNNPVPYVPHNPYNN